MTLICRQVMHLAVTAIAALAVPTLTWAQSYPTRPVRVIIHSAAGGPGDIIARLMAKKLSESFGQQVYVENIVGGGGRIGIGAAAKARADGHTILMANNAPFIIPSLYAEHPFDPIKDFEPITLAGIFPQTLVIHPSFPANSVEQLVAEVKRNPGKYSYASPGVGTTTHLQGEQFKHRFGLDLTHVPFNGAAPAIVSTVGGHTLVAFAGLEAAAPFIKEGKLRALAVTTAKRASRFPDVPTLADAGIADMESFGVHAILAPAGTPREIVKRWHREVARIIALPDVKPRLEDMNFEAVANTPDEFADWIKGEVSRWRQVIRDANMELK